MIIEAKTTDGKLQCEINRKAAKMQHYNKQDKTDVATRQADKRNNSNI